MPGFELIDHEERRAVEEVFERGGVLFRRGFEPLRSNVYTVRAFELAFARAFGVKCAHAVTSGTAAIKVGLKALGIQPGDEVITQAFTFVATAEAILDCGAIPILTEIDETLTMDPEDLRAKLSPRTKAVIPVHMLGAPARLQEILCLAEAHGVPVLEDAAQACGGRYRGACLGTLGTLGTFSFDFGKTLTTGEGGMIVTNDAALYERARAYSDHGHDDNPTRPRGEDTRSTYGFNYRMMELQGAIGLVQLRKLDGALKRQQERKQRLKDALRDLPSVRFRPCADEAGETGEALVFFLPDPQTAQAVARELFKQGIRFRILPEALAWHFAGTWDHMLAGVTPYQGIPLHERWPNSERILRSAIALPILLKMDEPQLQSMIDTLRRVLEQAQRSLIGRS